MSKIIRIHPREILDSRGIPTVEIELETSSGIIVRSSVPSGISIGEYEAVELRDLDKKRYMGKGVKKAIDNINKKITSKLLGLSCFKQNIIDQLMIDIDGTNNKNNLGTNAILGISVACVKASAAELKIPLYQYIGGIISKDMPLPLVNILNGGKHANNNLDIQEFMIAPIGAKTFSKAIRMCSEIFHSLGKILYENNYITSIGDEGGYAPNLNSNIDAINFIIKAIEAANYFPGKDIAIALDVAAGTFFRNGSYIMMAEKNIKKSSDDMIQFYIDLVNKYPIISIEDGLSEKDWDGWKILTNELGSKIQLVGDDLFVTNKKRLQLGVENAVANSILIKINQIGTISETLDTIKFAKEIGYNTIISHRSGETNDTFIADLAVGANLKQIKSGSITRGERLAKYNQLLRIEESLKSTS